MDYDNFVGPLWVKSGPCGERLFRPEADGRLSQFSDITLMDAPLETQEEVCFRFGVVGAPPGAGEKLGIALETVGKLPINGLRIRLEGTCGWFIWAGAGASNNPNFYQPLHVEHIAEYLPSVEPYLSLPPGYRFQIADGYEDVWFDSALLSEK